MNINVFPLFKMEFHVFDGQLRFSSTTDVERTEASMTKTFTQTFKINFNPVITNGQDRSTDDFQYQYLRRVFDESFGKALAKFLVKNCDDEGVNQSSKNKFGNALEALEMRLTVYLTMTSSKTGNIKIIICSGGPKEVNMFERLSALPPKSVGFNWTVKRFGCQDCQSSDFLSFNGKDLKIKRFQCGNYGLEMSDIQFPGDMWFQWKGHVLDFLGNTVLSLTLDYSAVNMIYLERFEKMHYIRWWPMNLLRDDDIASDAVILTGDTEGDQGGEVVKCHKCILSGRSPVFRGLFKFKVARLNEGEKILLEVKEMTAAGVRAFLQFIYYWNFEEAMKSVEIAFELVKAGYKYQVEDLEDLMIEIICLMDFDMWTVDVAIKMLIYARIMDGKLMKVGEKSLIVLKWYAHKFPDKLLGSKEYKTLFMNEGQLALELGALFLKI